jgi:hypothetical protein
MTASPPPFETATLLCDGVTCSADVIGSALVRHPHDTTAIEQAKRAARRDAIDKAIAAGWQVGKSGMNRDYCERCKEGR